MTNLLLALLSLVISFGLLILINRNFGKGGVFMWICMATIVANIEASKTIEIFGITATLGNVMYGSVFLATDILNELHSKKDASKSVWYGMISTLLMIIFLRLAIRFIPANSDTVQTAMETLFMPVTRIVVAGLVAFVVSQFLDIKLFNVIKNKTKGKHLWLRNNVATIISQLIDTLLFVSIAFIGVYEKSVLIDIYLTTFVFKVIVALLDTPFIYLARKFRQKDTEKV